MKNKKDLPLTILKSLEPFVALQGEKFNIVDPKDFLLHVVDIDSKSNFYFKIEIYERKQSGFQFLMDRRPKSEHENGNYRIWIEIKDLQSQFEQWIKLLEQYENVNSFYDDPIIKFNAESFFAKYEIIDENSEVASFELERQLFLEDYLTKVQLKLESLKENQSAEKIEQIELLKEEAEEIKSVLTSESKKKIMKRLSRFWGRAQKTGLDIIKEILVRVTTEIAKGLMMG